MTQKSERTISSLEKRIANLEREVTTHNAGAEEVNREHSAVVEVIKNEKAMVEVHTIELLATTFIRPSYTVHVVPSVLVDSVVTGKIGSSS